MMKNKEEINIKLPKGHKNVNVTKDNYLHCGSNDNTMLDPGESMGFGDHFYNTDEGDGTNYPLEYVFKFFELNGNGDPITITYRYDGTASV